MLRARVSLFLLVGCASPLPEGTSDGGGRVRPDGLPRAGRWRPDRPGPRLRARATGRRSPGPRNARSGPPARLAGHPGRSARRRAARGVRLPRSGWNGAVARTYGLEAAADGGAIFVYPDAVQGTWDVGGRSPDASRVQLILRRLSETRCIDPERVFIAGFSAGAVFTLYLGCNVPTPFRAMAVIAGSDRRFDTRCCTGAISAVFIHGTHDDTIPLFDGEFARNRTLGSGPVLLHSDGGRRRVARPTPAPLPGRWSSAPGPGDMKFRSGPARKSGISSNQSSSSTGRDHPAGVAGGEHPVGDVAGDDAAGADHRPRADPDPGEDQRPAADPDVRADLDRLAELLLASQLGIERMQRGEDLHAGPEEREVADAAPGRRRARRS